MEATAATGSVLDVPSVFRLAPSSVEKERAPQSTQKVLRRLRKYEGSSLHASGAMALSGRSCIRRDLSSYSLAWSSVALSTSISTVPLS